MLAGDALPEEDISHEDNPTDLEDWLPGQAKQRSRSMLSDRGSKIARLESDTHSLHTLFPTNTGRADREALAIEEGFGDARYAQATLHGTGQTGGRRLGSKSRSKQRNSMAAQVCSAVCFSAC